ncbi:MAG: NAD(P)/FAD-dependent oxidoreductase, partial [Clostridia bacterium]|nr:NAD(P)/FAD-dependent oxidoreductase [Clostridia bacterium]
VTNLCSVEEFIPNVVHNPRFLYTALSLFSPADTYALIESLGVPLKTERGRRVFPVSDKAVDIADALKRYAKGAKVVFDHISAIRLLSSGRWEVTGRQTREFDSVILTTGGKSYPLTGSDGSGYLLAEQAGHTVTPPVPSLVPLTSPSPVCRQMQGLSLKNVGLSIERKGVSKPVYEDFGEMMFTHFGVTGPIILSASSFLHNVPFRDVTAFIDLKPALDEKALDARLLRDFEAFANKNFENALSSLLPAKMIPVVVSMTGIPNDKKVNSVSRSERAALLTLLKRFPVPLDGFRPMEEAIITAGGVNVSEVSPKTMQSKLCPGLFFAGEILDVDALTGGYNLQIAFSTGHLAGVSAAQFLPEN